MEVIYVDEIVGTNAYIDGVLQPKKEGATYKVSDPKYSRCYEYLLKRVTTIFMKQDPMTASVKAYDWMREKNPMLGGVTPVSMIANGKGNRLDRFITEAEGVVL